MKQLAFALFLVACGGGGGGGGDINTNDAGGGSQVIPPDAGPNCGNGRMDSGETCDDGNTTSNDGCSSTCQIESGYACGDPGTLCLTDHTCGNGIVEDTEGCDDHNTNGGDGCNANCQLEPGWTCPVAGIRCKAAQCGDGIVAGTETCDTGSDPMTGVGTNNGCDANCNIQVGWKCDPGVACVQTHCGDGVAEGLEECDDGNNDLGDGCTPFCTREPVCSNGDCTAVCGDNVIQAGEECDDGNTRDFDGCSHDCKVETGFHCSASGGGDTTEFDVPVVYRDFKGYCNPGQSNDNGTCKTVGGVSQVQSGGHMDFERKNGAESGILGALYSPLAANHKPVYNPTTMNTTSGQANFDQWYKDSAMSKTFVDTLAIPHSGATNSHTYVYSNSAFFPLDTRGWVTANPAEPKYNGHNFNFTSELRYWFQYSGTEDLKFFGDDDVWVFINNKLALDIGGVHGSTNGEVNLANVASNLGLTVGKTYEVVVFQAERHTTASTYQLTLQGFNAQHSTCDDTCGDGVTSTNEACDDGTNDGSYGSCTPDCLGYGPRCGDGTVQSDHEQCDDGANNTGGYGHCNPNCTLGPRCGDGIVQPEHEECDDGNDDPNDGCDMCHHPIL
ncbi:MAG: DUF4215 domain-containing protein [Kofleriaceae bacterium]